MTDGRRYSEEEVSAIFERATEVQQVSRSQPVPTEGMTLVELQEVGQEVGISPEAVADAAKALDRPAPGLGPRKRFLGLPIGVGRTVDLGRTMTDAEWDRLVVDLRETFDARGTVKVDGSFRQWTNGNLQALVEPTETGHRLRLKTFKGTAGPGVLFGLVMLAMSAMQWFGAAAGIRGLVLSGLLAAMGAALIGATTLRLPGWARLREEQMEAIAARAQAAIPPTAIDAPTPRRPE